MRRLVGLAIAIILASGLAAPAHAQGDQASCVAQMSATVRPLLEQAGQFSPQGVGGQGFAPLAQPFAPGPYGSPTGYYPAAPWLPPPTAAYNASANYTVLAGLPPLGGPQLVGPNGPFGPPGQGLSSTSIAQFLQAGGQLNLNNPAQANPTLLVGLANLQQTEQARQQQQALLQQQQGFYQNSLYQLSSSYQTTSLDWQEAYSTLAQAWMSYYRDLCGGGSGATASR
jgi:hypothetical protein